MTVGLEVIGDSGYYQIVDNLPVFRMRESKSATVAASSNTVVTFTFTASQLAQFVVYCPDVFVGADPSGTFSAARTYSGGVWTLKLLCKNDDPTSKTVTIYCFDTVLPASAATFGLQVFDADGGLSYSSEQFPLRIVGRFRREGNTTENDEQEGSPPSRWGFLLARQGMHKIPATDQPNVLIILTRTPASSISMTAVAVGQEPAQPVWSTPHEVFFINLTGL